MAPFHFNEYLAQLPPALVRGRRVPWLEGKTALAYGMSVLPGMLAARRERPDVLHNTYYFPVRPPSGTRGVVTIYDMIHEKFPEYFGARPLIARLKAASIAGCGSRDLHFGKHPTRCPGGLRHISGARIGDASGIRSSGIAAGR